ncbi:MAG: Phosphate ABC transporter, permease protein (PstA) [Archaeoglobus fulgidus]|uniref:Phosphate transport system permease protein PstA n=1 Tax=Archaeoglobus fulgidus TaxID=2234 RepID=A0A101DY93_ARCFL|nr:phosphate ABC transporter permease PstA [Archaeoglobus fulgidus]KUJ93164.1 MAG: Phosphate ABC transporter, permease protein (PstA) [Archaeoglobus fulgidus]KUK05473.1 MAG: Phosphate ABC transporter, permease protein (PstA) [Archaeoglobus fulgidus]
MKADEIKEGLFMLLALAATVFGVVVLAALLVYTFVEAAAWLDLQFLTSPPSRFPEKAGIFPSLVGSIMAIALVGVMVLPLGVGAAIYLEEYARKNWLTKLIEINISNLAAVPSIVYGLLGLGLFVSTLGLKPGIVLVGSLTLTLLVLPIVIVAAQESLRAVPFSLREASLAVGATKWQTVKSVVLPSSLPGIMTGVILALSRAIGETAPLIMIGVATATFTAPKDIFSTYSALPMLIFMWTDMPKEEFLHGLAPAAIVVLLAIMLSMNAFAVYLRNKFARRLR